MDAYWELSDFDIKVRQNGFEHLLSSLNNSSKSNDAEKSGTATVDYALNRLVKGLVSNRKCARIGFAAALGTLVNHPNEQWPMPTVDELLSSIQNKLATRKETGVEDAKNVRIGRVLGYIAVAHAQKDQDLTLIIQRVLPDLLSIRKQETRRRLRTFIDASIVQLSKWSGRKLFKKEILPLIQDHFPTVWQITEDANKSIFLLVSLANLYPKVFDANYFESNWNRAKLPLGTTEDEQKTIIKSLQSFDNELHLLEQLCRELLIYSIRSEQLSTFWPVLIEELSNIGFDSNKGHILLELMSFSFEENDGWNAVDIIETIVQNSQPLIVKMLNLFSTSARKTHQQSTTDLAKTTLDKLAKTLSKQSLTVRLNLFDKLLNCADKHYSGLQSVAKAISENLTADEFLEYVQFITKLFCTSIEDDESATDRRRHFLLEMLSNLCDCKAFDLKVESCSSIYSNILSMCVLLMNFQIVDNHIPKPIRQLLNQNIELSDATREHLEDVIYKFIMYEFHHHHQYERSYEVFRKAKSWCESSKHYSPVFEKSDQVKVYLKDSVDEVFELIQGETIQSITDEKLRLAFQQVCVLSLFDLFDDVQRAQQYLNDLVKCVTNAHSQKGEKQMETDESSWIEVFVDILLSMYTKKQHDIRSMIKKIYQNISSYLNENALRLMLQTIAVEEEDDDDDDDDDEDDGDEDDGEEDDESDNDDDGDEESMDDGEVNEDLRKAVEKALGDAAVKTDQDEPDMDDEAMLRLDPLIADAFRSQIRKSSNTKIINEKLHHQFRVLDLIESVIKKDERMRFVLISIRPLIETLNSLPNTPAYKTMNERLDSILSQLSNRKIDHSDKPTTDECVELFRYLTSLAGTRMKLSLNTLIKVSMFVIKLALHVGKSEDRLAGVEELILTSYESGFLRFLLPNQGKEKQNKKNKKNKNKQVNGDNSVDNEEDKKEEEEEEEEMSQRQSIVPPAIIREFLVRFPEYRPRLMVLMVETALKDTINWKKRNVVCGTLNNFLTNKQLENVEPALLEATLKLLVKLCNDPKSSKIESLHVITVLTQKVLLIRKPQLSEKQAQTLLDAVSTTIKAKQIKNDKQRKQLLNLMDSFRKRYHLTIADDVLTSLGKKRKEPMQNGNHQVEEKKTKKMKVEQKSVPVEEKQEIQQPVTDCRQMPFKGIVA